ncbi:MAG: hypothetical protein PHQ54_04940, partial [Candidatus Omnitrophica bacterium]|nr:hypothetical protein [Candidatus Omnitrophota bacterium]
MLKLFSVTLLCVFSLSVVNLTIVEADDVSADFTELKSDLENAGISAKDAAGLKRPVTEMLKNGAKKEDLKKVISDLSSKGLKGKDLSGSVT